MGYDQQMDKILASLNPKIRNKLKIRYRVVTKQGNIYMGLKEHTTDPTEVLLSDAAKFNPKKEVWEYYELYELIKIRKNKIKEMKEAWK